MVYMILLNNGDDSNVYRVTSYYTDDVLHISIMQKSTAFISEVNQNDIAEFADYFEIDTEKYFQQLQNYLQSKSPEITAEIKNNEFILYKNSSVTFFRVRVRKTNYNTHVEILLDNMANSNKKLEERLNMEVKEKEALRCENYLVENKLKEFELFNSQHEKKLYSCFVQLLNEKKRRIQFLTEILEAPASELDERKVCSSTSSTKKRKLEHCFAKKLLPKKKENVSDSDSDKNDYNTDDSFKLDSPEPSTSKSAITKQPQYLPPRSVTCEAKSTVLLMQEDSLDEDISEEFEVIASPDDAKSPDAVLSTQDIIDRM